METFREIYGRAAARHRGDEGIGERLPDLKAARQLRAQKDDRYLATMTKCVFRSGFVWRVVQAKWSGFEEAFSAFDPETVAALSIDDVDRLAEDTRIIRHRKKIESAVSNAEMVLDVVREHGSFGRFLSDWPAQDTTGLWAVLKQDGQRLGATPNRCFCASPGATPSCCRATSSAI
ncbi:MAG: DNA-3-methyladenine glycosylase I [Acidobacteriota bacterium]|nr:DNA-3-methyladenine glycosylase I [Acidobacteriota bacterium]